MEGAGRRETEKGGDICVLTADSCCYTAESDTTLTSNYPPIKKKFLNKKDKLTQICIEISLEGQTLRC